MLGCARIAVEKMAQVCENERTLVLTDPYYLSKSFPNLVFESCLACGAESAKLTTTPPTELPTWHPQYSSAGDGITQITKTAANAADVVFACTSRRFPLGAKREIVGKGKRLLQMYCLNDEMICRLTLVDLELMQRRVKKLLKILPQTEKARVTSPGGTDVTLSLKNCTMPIAFDGVCHPGEYDALPGGAVDALPVPGTGYGRIVIDGTLQGWGVVSTPVRVTVKDGKFTRIEGGPEAAWLDKSIKKALAAGDENANHWAEFFLGMHPNARMAGYPRMGDQSLFFEDELVLGAMNIGWGADVHLRGKFSGKYHSDGLVRDVTVTLDEVPIIEDGNPTKELQ